MPPRLAVRPLLLAPLLLAAAAAHGQSLAALPRAEGVDTALRPLLGLEADEVAVRVPVGADWEPPPALYWAGVGLDVVFLAGGTYLLVQGVRFLTTDLEEAGPGAIVLPMVGALFAVTGGLAAAFGGVDLVRVARGHDPLLTRPFDPTRPPPGTPPRFPPPPRPPYR